MARSASERPGCGTSAVNPPRLRYAFAGAEKLKEETRCEWSEDFGVRVFEGYCATETAPILSMNSPMQNRTGSVGKLAPGIEYRLDPVPGNDDGGRLWVKGPNVMRGYLLTDNPDADRDALNAYARDQGVAAIAVPSL